MVPPTAGGSLSPNLQEEPLMHLDIVEFAHKKKNLDPQHDPGVSSPAVSDGSPGSNFRPAGTGTKAVTAGTWTGTTTLA